MLLSCSSSLCSLLIADLSLSYSDRICRSTRHLKNRPLRKRTSHQFQPLRSALQTPTASRSSQRFATKCSSGHCGKSFNSACPNASAGGRFIAKEPPRLGGCPSACARLRTLLLSPAMFKTISGTQEKAPAHRAGAQPFDLVDRIPDQEEAAVTVEPNRSTEVGAELAASKAWCCK